MQTRLQQNRTVEPISPELVLVDPTLQVWLRSVGVETSARTANGTAALSAAPVTIDCADDIGPPTSYTQPRNIPSVDGDRLTSRDRRHTRAVVVAGLSVLLAAAVLLLALPFGGQDGDHAVRADASAVHVNTPVPSASSGSRSAQPPLTWTPVPHASFYDLVLIRNGKRVLDTWPRRNHISVAVLQKRGAGRLTPGRYEWYVYPGFGNRSAHRGHTFYGEISARGTVTIHRR